MEDKDTDNVAVTVMALREVLMEYFKGSCVQKMTKNSNVRLYDINQSTRGMTRAERWRLSFKQPSILLLDNVPLATLGKEPDTVTIHSSVTDRSKQLREIEEGLQKFLRTYLPGVRVVKRKGSVFYG